jgi:glycosyltransferase involved in cell wall biosynthesis
MLAPADLDETDVRRLGDPRRPLRVFVDASNYKPVMTGLRTYTRGLVLSLADHADLELTVATSLPDDFADVGNCAVVPIHPRTQAPRARVLWRETKLPGLLRKAGADVLLGPGHEGPLRKTSIPSIVVIHDIGPLVAPSLFGRRRWVEQWLTKPSMCKNASAVVCDSHATFRALYAAIGIPPEKCVVIGAGPQVGGGTSSAPPEAPTGAAPYVLYAGSLFPHKNVASLVQTFVEHDLSPIRLRLVGPVREHERRMVDAWRSKASDGVVMHEGYVSQDEIRALYRNALAVALPSLYEGYGLTALEALHAGTPLVTTDLPSVRELCGGAALYVDDPFDTRSWASAFRLLAGDSGMRTRLTREAADSKGLRVSWDDVSAEFAALIRRVAATGPRGSIVVAA